MRKNLLFILATSTVVLIATPAPSQTSSGPEDGSAIFKRRCAACHGIGDKKPRMGPDLAGIVGRRPGNAPGYNNASAAMKAVKKSWTPAALDDFLAAPTKEVPGTRMTVRVTNPQERKALVAYLTGI